MKEGKKIRAKRKEKMKRSELKLNDINRKVWEMKRQGKGRGNTTGNNRGGKEERNGKKQGK